MRCHLSHATDALQGSFGGGTFAAYVPALREAELCDVPGAGDD